MLKVECSNANRKNRILGKLVSKVDSAEIGEICYCEVLDLVVACSLGGNTVYCFDFGLNLVDKYDFSSQDYQNQIPRSKYSSKETRCKKYLQIFNEVAI